jgi:hypothetical protein
MEPTLEEALAKLYAGATDVVPSVGSTAASAQNVVAAGGLPAVQASPGPTDQAVPQAAPQLSADIAAIVASANDHFTRAQDALRTGDWARYGEEQRALEADLRRLGELTR